MNTEVSLKKLFQSAEHAAGFSYSPYSHFRVGAALQTENGEIITGTNIENRSYGLTNCAERSALFTALSRGIDRFKAIAIYCPDADYPVPPCGACRQVLSEFVTDDFPVYFAGKSREYTCSKMGELLPNDSLHELKNTRE